MLSMMLKSEEKWTITVCVLDGFLYAQPVLPVCYTRHYEAVEGKKDSEMMIHAVCVLARWLSEERTADGRSRYAGAARPGLSRESISSIPEDMEHVQ